MAMYKLYKNALDKKNKQELTITTVFLPLAKA